MRFDICEAMCDKTRISAQMSTPRKEIEVKFRKSRQTDHYGSKTVLTLKRTYERTLIHIYENVCVLC